MTITPAPAPASAATVTAKPRSVTITLDLPARELSPNYTVGSRGGRLGKAAKIKKYRLAAGLLSRAASVPGMPWPDATVQATFYVKTKQRRDKDNLLSALKAAFDGLADGGVVTDDASFTYLPVRVEVDKAQPRVVLVVTNTGA